MLITIEQENSTTRVDKYVTDLLLKEGMEYITRSLVQEKLNEACLVNNKPCKQSYKLKEGDIIDINIKYWEELGSKLDLSDDVIAQQGDLDIKYEDDDLIVLFKPKGLVVHPGVGNKQDTLANYLRGYLQHRGEYDQLMDRCGIVHRLDKGVSGLMVVAKNKETQEFLKKQFQEHKVVKIYLAKVEQSGKCNDSDFCNLEKASGVEQFIKDIDLESQPWINWYPIDGYIGRSSKNRYKMEFRKYEFQGSRFAKSFIKPFDNHIVIKIETGRMHQIRATLSYLGLHIIGDGLYGTNSKTYENEHIELESVILSFLKPNGERLTVRKYE